MQQDKIVVLKGPDRVRKRPAVIFKTADEKGVAYGIKMITELFFDEARIGHGDRISVTVFEDNSYEIKVYGCALRFDESDCDGKPFWYYNYADITANTIEDDFGEGARTRIFGYRANRFDSNTPEDSFICLYLTAFNFASEYMHIISVYEGVKRSLYFKAGFLQGGLNKEETTDDELTLLRFKPDIEVFANINVPHEDLADIFRSFTSLLPSLTVEFCDRRTGQREVF